MKINVQLHGSLRDDYPDYRHSAGVEFDVPEQSTVEGLLKVLKIKDINKAVVICKGRILKLDDLLNNDCALVVLETISGG